MVFDSRTGSEAAAKSWENTPRRSARTARARLSMTARFARLVDPEGVLPAEQLAVMVEEKRREHFAQLGRRSAAAHKQAARDAAALARILAAPTIEATAAAAVAALVDAS